MTYIKIEGMVKSEIEAMFNAWINAYEGHNDPVWRNADNDIVKSIDVAEWDGIHREWDLRHDVTFLLGFIAGNSIEDDMEAYLHRLRFGLKSDFALGSVPDMAVKMSDVNASDYEVQ